jgi:hypothetical protein
MKQFFTLLMMLVSLASFAQTEVFNVNAKMWAVYKGNPQKLVIEESGEVVRFDRNGRVTSYMVGTDEIRYVWNGNKITLSAYQNGNKIGDEYMTVISQTSKEINISATGVTVRETFNNDGQGHQLVMTSNGQTMTETIFYKDDAQHTPTKIVTSFGGQTETIEVKSLAKDIIGNWIKMTASHNGQPTTVTRSITYY